MPQEFTFFDAAAGNDEVRKAYTVMQAQYVLRPEDRIEYDAAMTALSEIGDRLMQNKAWTQYKVSMKLKLQMKEAEADRQNRERAKTLNRDDPER